MSYVYQKERFIWGSRAILVGGRFKCELPLEKLNIYTLSDMKSSPSPFNTLTSYFSASSISLSHIVDDFPNDVRYLIGFAASAPFFVPTLLVMSHPVSEWTAGRTENSWVS